MLKRVLHDNNFWSIFFKKILLEFERDFFCEFEECRQHFFESKNNLGDAFLFVHFVEFVKREKRIDAISFFLDERETLLKMKTSLLDVNYSLFDVVFSFCNVARFVFDVAKIICNLSKYFCYVAKCLCDVKNTNFYVANSFCNVEK